MAARAVELRVHGVSGTPPSAPDMLGRQDVEQVAGDDTAGFYRRATHELSADGSVLEAYSWGKLTSGAATRALWLLLLPFTLVNVAFWMRPAAATRRGRLEAVTGGLIRLFALSLTATITLAAVGVAVDLAGWQCAGPGRSCGARHAFLSFLGTGWWSQPGRRMLAAAAGPVAFLALLWYLGNRTWLAYESVRPPAGSGERHPARLAEPGFWYGRRLVGRLRAVHVGAAAATLGTALSWPAWQEDRRAGDGLRLLSGAAVLAAAVVLVAAALAVAVPAAIEETPAPPENPADRAAAGTRHRLPAGIRAAGLAAAVLSLAALVPSRPDWRSRGPLPGYEPAVQWLFVGQAAGLLALAVGLAVARRGRPDAAPALRGQAATVVAGIGLVMAASFTAGVTYRVADWLDGGRSPDGPAGSGAGPREPLTLPRPYGWASLGFLAVVLVLAGFAVWVVLRRLPAAAAEQVPGVRADYGLGPDPGLADPQRVRQVAAARGSAAATDAAGSWLGKLFVLGVVLAVPVVAAVVRGRTPAQVLGLPADSGVLRWLTNVANWTVSLFALGLVALGRQAYRSAERRRRIGIVWDLGTFWPRAAHPLAPPCYAERSVPDLVCRLEHLGSAAGADPPEHDLVVAAHSQGSVLAAAAVLQLPAGGAGLGLLTFGSPLRRLYGHYFPAYFDASALECVRAAVGGRWRNLYRPTDPIGGPVFGPSGDGPAAVDRRLPFDPSALARQPGNPSPEPIRGHSGYQHDPAYAEALAVLRQVLGHEVDDPRGW